MIPELIQRIIFHDPAKNYRVKGDKSKWNGLPKSKSLFYANPGRGLPIGNLTSQLFANIYLNGFDHFVKQDLKIKYYGRYVDDMVFVHNDKAYLRLIITATREYLKTKLKLEVHGKKIYLQHYSKGVKFLGAFIKPYRIYIDRRAKGYFYKKIMEWKLIFEKQDNRISREQAKQLLASFNSYLGLLGHYNTYNLRVKAMENFLP